jgi:hypothetical protein
MSIAVLLTLACLANPGPEDLGLFSFELAGGDTFLGEWVRFDQAGVELSGSSGSKRLGPGELVLVTAEQARPGPGDPPGAAVSHDDILLLAAAEGQPGLGDRLVGRLVGGDDVDLRFRIDGGPEVVVPFEIVDRLLPSVDGPLDRLALLEAPGFDDRIWRRRSDASLDAVAGVVAMVSADSVMLESALGDLQFAWSEVLAMVLADTQHPGRRLEGWPVRLALRGGSIFEAGLLSVTSNAIVVDTQFAERMQLAPSELASMVLSDRMDLPPLLISNLSPSSVDEWPSLGHDEDTLFPWQRDLSVAGEQLRLDGLPRVTGLGVHANSRLTFEVPPEARRLRIEVGLSDDVNSIPAQGSVSFEILLDGRSVASVERFDEGDEVIVLRVDGLSGGGTLELLVGDAGDHDAGDRALWIDGLFSR